MATRFVRVASNNWSMRQERQTPDLSHACLGIGFERRRGHWYGPLGQMNSSEVLYESWTAAAAATLR
ncbi:hypothetical protein J7T55_007359 [Diaporthe amygdali]|uniref:uncharacterized protein n=1 Tax=Phomopsis amygdali TaxID=1214568 RepID=UPI0022FED8A1|nr:uncharacterized protein J7T55_007359 [Diaporthe amygdali]KAJ0116379.1 hypothetical protein J7T55_007359 [Diaporthe amygdali]